MNSTRGDIFPLVRRFGLARKAHYKAARLAGLLGLGLRQLERCFAHDVGLTPKEWLQQQRMVDARNFLPGASSIKVAGLELGYRSASNFARDFKRCYGVTPKQFVTQYQLRLQKSRFESSSL